MTVEIEGAASGKATPSDEHGLEHSRLPPSPEASTARARLQLIARHRRVTDPSSSGRMIRQLMAEVEADLFRLSRWRRISEDTPIAEWRA